MQLLFSARETIATLVKYKCKTFMTLTPVYRRNILKWWYIWLVHLNLALCFTAITANLLFPPWKLQSLLGQSELNIYIFFHEQLLLFWAKKNNNKKKKKHSTQCCQGCLELFHLWMCIEIPYLILFFHSALQGQNISVPPTPLKYMNNHIK